MSLVRLKEEVLAPLPECDEAWKQAASLLCQHVFLARDAVGCWDGVHGAVGDEVVRAADAAPTPPLLPTRYALSRRFLR